LIRYRGRRTGREITTPTQFVEFGDQLIMLVAHQETKTWWRNFITDGDIEVLLQRQWVPMTARAVLGASSPATVTPLWKRIFVDFRKRAALIAPKRSMRSWSAVARAPMHVRNSSPGQPGQHRRNDENRNDKETEMLETKNDETLQSEVVMALQQLLTIRSAHIGVSATDGAVTLTGEVETVNQRFDAVEATQKVDGVLAVADEIQVRSMGAHYRSDTDIAVDIAHSLSKVSPGPTHLSVDVVDRVVHVSGQVPRLRDRDAVERAALRIVGVRNVVNNVSIGPVATQAEVEEQIYDVFAQKASEIARAVTVEIDDGHVLLRGSVPSLADKILAEQAVYDLPGIRKLVNHIRMHT
jgi:osmotically-inducible protein OsmY